MLRYTTVNSFSANLREMVSFLREKHRNGSCRGSAAEIKSGQDYPPWAILHLKIKKLPSKMEGSFSEYFTAKTKNRSSFEKRSFGLSDRI